MGERELCKLEVIGSIPFASTNACAVEKLLVVVLFGSSRNLGVLVVIRAALGSPVDSGWFIENCIGKRKSKKFLRDKIERATGGCLGAERR